MTKVTVASGNGTRRSLYAVRLAATYASLGLLAGLSGRMFGKVSTSLPA